MFQAKASNERFDVVKSLKACKSKPRASIYAFVLERKRYFDRLESLNMVFDAELSININLSEVVTPVKPYDISLPIHKTSGRVNKPPRFYYGFHIEVENISDSTLSELDEPANYKEAMASPEAAK
uniref:Uncharacterized protein n=1 Tax=Tanacetum cinerariifolium TaxID=118510 RepID=A0A699GRU0_TANCI|nr:hypothetical protein [Tanacetum cinerariifolium]